MLLREFPDLGREEHLDFMESYGTYHSYRIGFCKKNSKVAGRSSHFGAVAGFQKKSKKPEGDFELGLWFASICSRIDVFV